MGNIVRFLMVVSMMFSFTGCDVFGVNATVDAEEQGEGEATAPSQVDEDDDGYPPATDCNDQDPNVNTATAENCVNGIDDDCDFAIDDADTDCAPAATPTPEDEDDDDDDDEDDDDYTIDEGDCDDDDPDTNPGVDYDCDGSGDNDCDGDVDEDQDENSCDEDEPDDEWADYLFVNEDDEDEFCFSDNGFDVQYRSAAAYLVGYGGSMNFSFQAQFKAEPMSGYYCFDSSNWTRDCYEFQLVSSLKSDGKTAATSSSDTGDWWDNYELCTSDSETDKEWCVLMSGTDYFEGACTTSEGVLPNGDGS